MGYSVSWICVSKDNTLQDIPVNTITFFIAIWESIYSVLAFVYHVFKHGIFMGLAVYVILLVCSLLLLYGHQKQKPKFYLPFMIFQIPLLLVSLLITTYSGFIEFFTNDEFKEKLLFTLTSIGIAFLDIVQLYFVYIVWNSCQFLKNELIRQQRMERIETADEMSVYP